MRVQSAPPATETIGPESWRESTVRSIRLAERLVRLSRGPDRAGSARSRGAAQPGTPPPRTAGSREAGPGPGEEAAGSVDQQDVKKVRPLSADTLGPVSPSPRLPPACLRERCAGRSAGVALEHMRGVRAAEAALRGEAARLGAEARRLGRGRQALEGALSSLRRELLLNRRCVEGRGLRPTGAETGRDGADQLLDRERAELTALKAQLEGRLRATVTQLQALSVCSRRLLDCAAERSRVLDLIPHTGSDGAGRAATPSPCGTSPTGPVTPECKEVMESSQAAFSQSQQLRQEIRQAIGQAVARQRATHQSVSEGLVRKIAETVTLSQRLALSSAATRQAVHQQQRQLDWIQHSRDSALGPVSSADLLTRERLDRPVVRVYQRHPGTQLPEAGALIQGGAVLRRTLGSSARDLALLQLARLRLDEDLRGKRAAARVDSAVLRMRRRHAECPRAPPRLPPSVC